MQAVQTLSILGCPCTPFSDTKAVKDMLRDLVQHRQGGYSVAINAEKIERFERDPALQSVIKGAALAVADGAGAVIGLRVLHGARSSKIDLPRTLLESSDEGRWRLFIGGASESVNAQAAKTIKERYPGIGIVGRLHGYATEEELVAAVVSSKPQVMLLAMGSPRQELIAAKIVQELPGIFIVGCGGALDILAGTKQRAPRFMVENNLEWLYRLYKEPSRWRRQLVLPRYMLRLLGEATRQRIWASGHSKAH